MKELYIFSIVIFVSYITFIVTRYGVQRSISDSWYRLQETISKKGNSPTILFTIFCWGIGFPTAIIGGVVFNSWLLVLAGGGIIFVGAATKFKKETTKIIHMVGAYGGVICSQLAMIFNLDMWKIPVLLLPILCFIQLYDNIENKIWYQELLAFSSIMLAIGIKLYM